MLTPTQRKTLEWIAAERLPASYRANGFTGLPAGNLDMRTVSALERRGLVESFIHFFVPRHEHKSLVHSIVLYRVTEAGRNACLSFPGAEAR